MTQDMLMAYFQKSTVITIVVLGWLSLYFIITFTILISRVIGLSVWHKNATSGLAWLAIIASTSPFIGLFGTVISILDTFSKLGSNSSIAVIAPAISEALVATGTGIFVAIPAYTFSLILKRKAFELMSTIRQSADILLLNSDGTKN